MWRMQQFAVALTTVALVGTGCATQSQTGLKARGTQDAQTVYAQVDLLEAKEVVEEEGGVVNAVTTWATENPTEAVLSAALAIVGGYVAYDELIDDSGSGGSPSPDPIQGVTQSGSGNSVSFKDVLSCPDTFQSGEGNNFSCDVSVEAVTSK